MTADQKPAPSAGGLTLYAHLVSAAGPGQISSAPVIYNQSGDSQTPANDAAPTKSSKTDFTKQLFQQRNKRPPQHTKGTRGHKAPVFPATNSSRPTSSSSPDKAGAENAPALSVGPVTTTSAADWISREEDDLEYLEERPSRYSKRSKKKKKYRSDYTLEIDWDEPYEPSKHTNFDLYRDSEDFREAENEWFEKLHRSKPVARVRNDGPPEIKDDASAYAQNHRNFAPPSTMNDPAQAVEDTDMTYESVEQPPMNARVEDDITADEAWARRAAMNSQAFAPPASATSPPAQSAPSFQNSTTATTISRAPVRFAPAQPTSPDADGDSTMHNDDDPSTVSPPPPDDAPRSKRPGQANFAERMLKKHGWKPGEGLGASGTGMTKPLYVKLDKPKKFSDAEGGGRRKAGTGKIIASGKGKKKGAEEEEDDGGYGKMSPVVVLVGVLDGVDIAAEMEAEEPLSQRIGDECSKKYGNVERVTADPETGRLFVQFTQEISAIRAVQALDGGSLQILDGVRKAARNVVARYYDAEKHAKREFGEIIKGEEVEE